jgi:ABC-type lipoprotein release transport system permease subunit
VAAVTAAVAMNTMLAIHHLSATGQGALLVAVFASLTVGFLAVSVDLFSRSSQTVASLRSVGASRGTISSAFALAILVYGIAGAAIGVLAGGAFGYALGDSATGVVSMIIDSACVIVASSGAAAAGFYAGARTAWRN